MKNRFLKNLFLILKISFIVSLFFFFLTTQNKTIENYLITLGISLLYSFGYGFSNIEINRYLNEKYSWVSNTKSRLVSGIISTIIINVVVTYVINYILFVKINNVSLEDFWGEKYILIHLFYIVLALLITTILHAYSFMKELKINAQEKLIAQEQLAKITKTKFESLKNQLAPHFLFNSLNVLSSLIEENPKKAQDFTDNLSKIYRYILEQKENKTVKISQEIDFAKTYAELMKMRFENTVNFHFDIPKTIEKQEIVPLSLQMLLENCIKHNHATTQKPLNVKIYLSEDSEYLIIENTLNPRKHLYENTKKEGVGLLNIQEQYALLGDKKVNIHQNNSNFSVEIPILKNK